MSTSRLWPPSRRRAMPSRRCSNRSLQCPSKTPRGVCALTATRARRARCARTRQIQCATTLLAACAQVARSCAVEMDRAHPRARRPRRLPPLARPPAHLRRPHHPRRAVPPFAARGLRSAMTAPAVPASVFSAWTMHNCGSARAAGRNRAPRPLPRRRRRPLPAHRRRPLPAPRPRRLRPLARPPAHLRRPHHLGAGATPQTSSWRRSTR